MGSIVIGTLAGGSLPTHGATLPPAATASPPGQQTTSYQGASADSAVIYTDSLGLAKVGPRAPALPYPQPPTPYPWGKPGSPTAPQGLPIDRDRPTGRPDRCERPDREEQCEQRRNEDESACAIPIIRYGYVRGKACLESAMIRYGECLRFGADGIRTPLHGVDTPL